MKMNVPIGLMLRIGFLVILLCMNCVMLHAQNPLVKQWDYRFGGWYHDELKALQPTTDGGIILGGRSLSSISGDKTQGNWDTVCPSPPCTGDYWVVKVNSIGIKQWDKRFGGFDDEFFRSLQQTTDGGYILGGY